MQVVNNASVEGEPAPRRSGGGDSWGTRHSLTLSAFVMCVLLYSLRFNLSIGIVAMVRPGHSSSSASQLNSDDEPVRLNQHEEMCSDLVDSVHYSNFAANASDFGGVKTHDDGDDGGLITLDWNEKDQGLVLGSFFWGYLLSQYPGGLLAHRYGAKWVISLGLLSAGLLSLALPPSAYYGGKELVMVVRILQGVGEGLVVPALLVLLAKWTTPQERARHSALVLSGMPAGTALTMISSGHLITAWGWPAVFYIPGVLTILWFLVWSMVVFSEPRDHPRISKVELEYLERKKHSGQDSSTPSDDNQPDHNGLANVPWSSILRSGPFWAIFVSQFCESWGHAMLKVEGPKYLHSALHFDIHQNSYLSAAPYVAQWMFCISIGRLSDYLIQSKILSLSSARKLCNTIGVWGPGAAFAGIVLSGCNRPLAVTCFMLSGLLNGATPSGAGINPMDISPNYVGALEGVINIGANFAGFGAPILAGFILQHEPTIIGWRAVFLIPVICNLIGNSAFLLGASVEPQPWDFKEKKNAVL